MQKPDVIGLNYKLTHEFKNLQILHIPESQLNYNSTLLGMTKVFSKPLSELYARTVHYADTVQYVSVMIHRNSQHATKL